MPRIKAGEYAYVELSDNDIDYVKVLYHDVSTRGVTLYTVRVLESLTNDSQPGEEYEVHHSWVVKA